MKTHTAEAPYLCKICNKRFKRIGILQRHKRSHSTEKKLDHLNPNNGSSAKQFGIYAGTQCYD